MQVPHCPLPSDYSASQPDPAVFAKVDSQVRLSDSANLCVAWLNATASRSPVSHVTQPVLPLQAGAGSMHRYKDYLPDHLSAVVEAFHYEVDLDEAMVSTFLYSVMILGKKLRTDNYGSATCKEARVVISFAVHACHIQPCLSCKLALLPPVVSNTQLTVLPWWSSKIRPCRCLHTAQQWCMMS